MAGEALVSTAVAAVDSYLTHGTDNCVFDEPEYRRFNDDLNAFLKWERLGKTEDDCPMLRQLLAVMKHVMGQSVGGHPSFRKEITDTLTD